MLVNQEEYSLVYQLHFLTSMKTLMHQKYIKTASLAISIKLCGERCVPEVGASLGHKIQYAVQFTFHAVNYFL